LRNKTN